MNLYLTIIFYFKIHFIKNYNNFLGFLNNSKDIINKNIIIRNFIKRKLLFFYLFRFRIINNLNKFQIFFCYSIKNYIYLFYNHHFFHFKNLL